ncbi:NAD-dependent epimerase/dehydratase family protein [Cryobacterium luteum]|uniref:NAD-dependent epimerase/dehydratase family protein n=1 Tax=Cryobacterium luteum TaxID=1424661 RepID=A0A1H8LF25_9MICO|nr:NAD-dependent epimerase/dehydratase family protein [Cryobacterium luteum]TFB91332.1 NAD-dependent epimerase/dehydratase family protein [Cryobacterium luteum]SEO03761.1 UDP-N-acetylmuramyl pentapeptide phosphotransferase/UDP-N-acetylglucosamine-1-phosphate transferase [Cryobacterium luteum]
MSLVLCATLAISLVTPVLLRPLLARMGIIDVPNERSSHARSVVRGAGLSPLIAIALGYSVFLLAGHSGDDTRLLLTIVGVSMASGMLGWVEDSRGLPVAARAGAQLVIGLAAGGAICAMSASSWWLLPILTIGVAGYINVANFMDGINGISSFHGVIVGVTYAVVGAMVEQSWMIPAGLMLATAFLGFLPWNLSRSGMFLGDVGSYLLGGGIAIIAGAAISHDVPLLAVLGPLAIYLADSGVTLIRRVASGKRWYEAHRSHVYQRLTDRGLSHIQVSVLVAVATIATSAFGVIGMSKSLTTSLFAVAMILVIASVYLVSPSFRGGKNRKEQSLVHEAPVPISDLPAHVEGHIAKKWAVIGASGFIGSALATELHVRGYSVVKIVAPRVELNSSTTAESVIEQRASNNAAIALICDQLEGIDVVVNAAGLASPNSPAENALFGANSLLPVLIVTAAQRAGVARVVHLSSAAVQGRREILDESASTEPFSPYSRSKALGEAALLALIQSSASREFPEVVIVRATSVQGHGRHTTRQLARLARSPFASVARPGDRPTVVSSLRGLVEFVSIVGAFSQSVPTILLQPWEGMTTASALKLAGGREPVQLPTAFCRQIISVGFAIGKVVTPLNGSVRRIELMWMGQQQRADWARSAGLEKNSYVRDVFSRASSEAS